MDTGNKAKLLVYTPFTGFGLYGGMRGQRWLRNRIKVFKQFVIPSLLNQTDRDFTHHISWRKEERTNPLVKELGEWLSEIPNYKFVFTFSGPLLYDDKYSDDMAKERLYQAIKGFPELMDAVPDCDELYMLIQPSDDLYDKSTIESVKKAFAETDAEAVVFTKGYICNYTTLETREYNPNTIPPFAAIRFNRVAFFDPSKHLQYISLKKDSGKYKKGIPYPSHEYLSDCLKTAEFQGRGFVVGCHGENISTHFNHPFAGAKVEGILQDFGIANVQPLVFPMSYRKWLMRKLPHQWQRKLRFWFGELIYQRAYNWLRN